MRRYWISMGLAVWAATASHALAQATNENATLETITTPRGVKQSFILMKPAKPVATVLLFAGSHGGLNLSSATTMKWGAGNFLVRARRHFVDQDLMVVVVDAPADKRNGMNAVFRMSNAHAQDIGAIVQHVRKIADVPVWMVGTSMGTFSSARGAIGVAGVNGLVLTSTLTRSDPKWAIKSSHPDGVASMALAQVKVPTLIMSHRDDKCDKTPAADSNKLKSRLTAAPKVEIKLLDGGLPAKSPPCEARSAHGFFGIEKQAIGEIANFIKAK